MGVVESSRCGHEAGLREPAKSLYGAIHNGRQRPNRCPIGGLGVEIVVGSRTIECDGNLIARDARSRSSIPADSVLRWFHLSFLSLNGAMFAMFH